MKAPPRPAGGHPWEQPGYTFWNGWPTGYTPTAADTHRPLDGRIAAKRAEASRRGGDAGWNKK